MTQRLELQKLLNAAPVGARQWRVIICCFLVVMLDGFDTAAIGFIAPDIRSHWQLTAGDLAPLFGAGLLGLTAGALLCGPLSDRFGRKRVIEFCVALFGLFSLLSAFAPDLQMLVFLRFLTGLGLGGAMPNTITMTSEYLPARRRGALVTLMFCGFTLGSAFGGVKGRSQLPGMVEDAMAGKIRLDPFITHRLPLEQINEAFDLMHEGKSIRTVIHFGDQ